MKKRIVLLALAACIAVAAGTGVAVAAGHIAIGPAAQKIAGMSPEDWENAPEKFDFDLGAEIDAVEEYVGDLEIITDAGSLAEGEAYNVLHLGTVGTTDPYVFCEYDPTLGEKLENPDVLTSAGLMRCPGEVRYENGEATAIECPSDKFCFVGLGSHSYVSGDTLYSFETAEFRCAECGHVVGYRSGDAVASAATESDKAAYGAVTEPSVSSDTSYPFEVEIANIGTVEAADGDPKAAQYCLTLIADSSDGAEGTRYEQYGLSLVEDESDGAVCGYPIEVEIVEVEPGDFAVVGGGDAPDGE